MTQTVKQSCWGSGHSERCLNLCEAGSRVMGEKWRYIRFLTRVSVHKNTTKLLWCQALKTSQTQSHPFLFLGSKENTEIPDWSLLVTDPKGWVTVSGRKREGDVYSYEKLLLVSVEEGELGRAWDKLRQRWLEGATQEEQTLRPLTAALPWALCNQDTVSSGLRSSGCPVPLFSRGKCAPGTP